MKFRFRTPHQLPASWAADQHALTTTAQDPLSSWFGLERPEARAPGDAPRSGPGPRAEQVWRARAVDVAANEDLLVES